MLVLGRKPGEYIVIDDQIIVKVIKSNNGDLRLAINAPEEVKIIRGELYEAESKMCHKKVEA
ncbi:MAG: carbon storage regulator [Bacillota bacterium]|nr:carbon storage regulator [Bacillota bacterium]